MYSLLKLSREWKKKLLLLLGVTVLGQKWMLKLLATLSLTPYVRCAGGIPIHFSGELGFVVTPVLWLLVTCTLRKLFRKRLFVLAMPRVCLRMA
jgi:hypothetical protein